MRLVHSFKNSKQAQVFSLYLSLNAVENKLEIDHYQAESFQIWIVQEEDLEKTQEYLKVYLADPNAKEFQDIQQTANFVNKAFEEVFQKKQKAKSHFKQFTRPLPQSFLTYSIIALCTALFLGLNLSTELNINLFQLLAFDMNLSSSAFPGFFSYIVYALKSDHAPLNLWLAHFQPFYKIQEGEWWRLFTPAILHQDLIHLVFNMIWLGTLGKQIEARVPFTRYLVFIILTAIFSNTCQYLMGGMAFLGFSGVVLAMIGFIWMRQKIAIWEGYMVHPSTFTFIAIYTLGLLALELVSTITFITSGKPLFSLSIANTAHISGWFIGALLGKTSFFKMKN